MPTQAELSHPFTLFKGDGATPEVFTRVPECGDITAPNAEPTEIPATTHDSEAKEFLLGLNDWGTATAEMNFIPSNAIHQEMFEEQTDHTISNYRVTDDPDDPSMHIEFAARVKGLPLKFGADDIIKTTLTLRCTGAAELVVAAS